MGLEWFVPASLLTILWVMAGTLAMYLCLLLLARLSGVRSFAQMSAFDVAVTIAIGSLLATTVAAKTPALAEGATALAVLFAIQLVASLVRSRYPGFMRATDNAPILLVGTRGEIKHENMRIARVTEDDLRAHLRQANVVDLKRVEAVVMEGTGRINVLHGHAASEVETRWILQGVRDYSRPE